MDNKYYQDVIKEMQPFFDENNITLKENYYSNDSKALTVVYDDARQMYVLSVAEVNEGEVSDFNEVNAWLFDDTQTARDAEAVGIDFVNTLRKEFGLKRVRGVGGAVTLPTASKDGTVDISGLSKKILDVFPALKDEYKAHVAHYGNFLYLNFYAEHLVPRIIRLFEEGTKKQIKKFYDIFENAYQKGDKDTVNTVVVILTAAAYNNEKVTAGIREMLAENSHFLSSFEMFIPAFAKNKKLKETFIKEN